LTSTNEQIEFEVIKKLGELKKDVDKELSNIQGYTEGVQNRFEDWSDIQGVKFDKFSDKISDKIDKVIETVNRKSEMDSALIAQIQSLSKRVDIVEVAKVGYDKYIAELNVKVDHLITMMTKHSLDKMNKDIGEAHTKLRDHEERIRPLEQARGRQAIKILWYIITLLSGSIAGILLSHLSHFMK